MERYFPQGIATDNAFCNRKIERAAIKNSIESHEHIVLIAPRRYGKSSLITQVLKENDFPGVCIDLFFVLTQTEVTKTITEGVSKVISTLLPKTKSATLKLIEAITAFNPKLIINLFGQVGLNPSGIKKALTDLSKLDMIYQDKNGYYRLLDPAVSYFIRKHSLKNI
jgi:AAA+ ATPase superfamily predicted ATPase